MVDIALVSGPASTPAGPEGFERIQVDLNAGRKGVDPCFLYVRRAAKWGDIDDLAPITDITVIASKDGTAEPPQGYDRIPLNVNDQGSFEVYLCIRRSRSGSPITEIDVIHGPKANVEVPHAFTKVPHDLNKVCACSGCSRVWRGSFHALAEPPVPSTVALSWTLLKYVCVLREVAATTCT